MGWRAYILNNFWWKLLSVLLATLIWLTIHSIVEVDARMGQLAGATDQDFANLPITVMTSAADLRGFQIVPSTATVTLRGEDEALKRVAPRNIQVYVNLTEAKQAAANVERIYAFAPPGFAVIKVTPPFVRVERVQP